MAADGYGDKGEPEFDDGGAPDTAVDPTLVAQYAGIVGNRVVGTSTERAAFSGIWAGFSGGPWDGLEFYETDTGMTYKRVGGAWLLWNDPTWRTATLGSSWTAEVGNVPQYRITSGLLVWRGRAQTTGTLTTFTTLPVGYRPDLSASGTSRFLIAGDSTTPGVLTITSAGVVTLSSGSTSIYYAIGSLPALSIGV